MADTLGMILLSLKLDCFHLRRSVHFTTVLSFFSAQSDGFRSKRSKHLLLEAAADRVEQMKANAEARKEAKRINDIYYEFGQVDLEARACREEMELQEVLRKNCEGVEILQKQMAAKEEQKRKEKELKEQEQEFLVFSTAKFYYSHTD